MKPFDIESAKAGHPLQTRDGLRARIVCYDVKGSTPILALIYKGDYEFEAYYDVAGRSDNPSLDLFMVTTKKEGWVNIYPNFSGSARLASIAGVYATKQEAIEAKADSYITSIKIEWEE